MMYSTGWYGYAIDLKLFLNGSEKNITVKGYDESKGWDLSGTTEWYTVSNKTSGTTPFYAQLYDTTQKKTITTSSTYQLTVTGASSVLGTIANFNVEGEISIPITKYNASFTDSLEISYGSTKIKTISPISNGSKVSFTDAELETIFNLMSTVVTGTFTFKLTTKSGSTTLGNSSITAKGSITDANPTFKVPMAYYRDSNSEVVNITEKETHIVQNKSHLNIGFSTAIGNKGASIVKHIVTVNGTTIERVGVGYPELEFGTINSSQDITAKLTAVDSRGNTTTIELPITVLAYSPPIHTVTLERLNNYEDETYLTVDASISSVNGKNTMSISYKVKQVGGEYGDSQPIENKTKYTLSCDKNYAYMFYVIVTDAFGEGEPKEYPLSKGVFPLFIDTIKNSVGINDFPAEDEALRVAGGVAYFLDGIKLVSPSGKPFIISVNDSGQLTITEKK